MKRVFTYLMMALMTMTFMTACDDDDDIAYTLEGTWRGNMYVSEIYNGAVYDATYTEITFLRDPYEYSSGQGYWVDYYDSGTPWGSYVANNIDWSVRNGVLYVYFRQEGTTIEIHDYRLSGGRFDGTIYYGNTTVNFELDHISSPNYGNYHWGFYDSYYSKKGSVTRSAGSGKPERIFRTNTDK